MAKELTREDAALLDELGVASKPQKISSYTPREERILAGFEEIQNYAETHGHSPKQGEGRDIFERICAIRLEHIRESEECRTLLQPLDHQHLLDDRTEESLPTEELDDDTLLANLGVSLSITDLRHVRPVAERQVAEEVASRRPCEDFDTFRPLFEQVQQELDRGLRETKPLQHNIEVKSGEFFILGGQKAYVADMGDPFVQEYGDWDSRLRVIFDNSTECDMLMRSLRRALHKDEAGRLILGITDGPLFAGQAVEGDDASGTIYVLRSKSDHPYVQEHRELIHKIGVTKAEIKTRTANTRLDPTFLMADVEVVATYSLYNINRSRLEALIHRIFDSARLQIEIKDRFGKPVVPREWFLVPLGVINEAVEKIKDGTVTRHRYDTKTASLVCIDSDDG